MEIKEFKDALKEMQNSLDSAMNERIKAKADADAVVVKELNEKIGSLIEQKDAMQEHLNALTAKNNELKIGANQKKSAIQVLEENLTAKAEYLKSMISQKKEGINFDVKAFDTKAAAAMTIGNYSGGTVGLSQWDPEFARVVRRQPFLRQIVSVRPTNKTYIAWAEQANRDGGAGNTAEGTAKTQADFDIVESSKKVEKITAYTKASKESLDDIDFLMSEIQNDLISLVTLKMDADLLSGSGTTPVMKGILGYAPAFSVTGSGLAAGVGTGVDQANEFDVIRAAVWQIQNSGLGAFMPNYVVVNPITAALMDTRKLTDGQYVIPPFVSASGQEVAGLRVIANTGITDGNFLVGDFSKSNLAIREDINISIGYDADDFTKNLVTILAEVRAAHYIKSNHTAAFVQGTFSTAKTAIEMA